MTNAEAETVLNVTTVVVPRPDGLVVDSTAARTRTRADVPGDDGDDEGRSGKNSKRNSDVEVRTVTSILGCSDHRTGRRA